MDSLCTLDEYSKTSLIGHPCNCISPLIEHIARSRLTPTFVFRVFVNAFNSTTPLIGHFWPDPADVELKVLLYIVGGQYEMIASLAG